MQKRIKFDQILNEKHKTYSEIWKNLLQSVNQSSPICNLDCFGAIAYIDKCLYLLIQADNLNNYVQVEPMINLQQYFLKPDCYRLNFRPLTKMERHVVEYFISYIQQAINTNQMVYLFVIDLQRLGKLIISRNTIEYINGKHQWKYQINKAIVKLPTLFQSKNQQIIEGQKMARKFSISVKKFVSLSTKKTPRNENRLKKSHSLVKLNTTFNKNLSQQQKNSLNNNRVATESYETRAKSKSKTQLQKLRIYKRERLQIKTEVIQDVKTQPSKGHQQKISRQSSRKRISIQKPSASKSRDLMNTQANEKRTKVQLKSDKHKLSLSEKPKLRIPSERRKLEKQSSQNQNQAINIMEFVRRSSSIVTEQSPFKDIEKGKINQFLSQITKIYMQSQPQVMKSILLKTKLMVQQAKMIKKFIIQQVDHNRLEQLLSKPQEDQRAFNYFYNAINQWKERFKHELQSYIVNYTEHLTLIQSIVDKFNECIQIKKLSHRSCVRIALLLHELYHFIQNMQVSLLNSIINKARKLVFINFNKQTSFKEDVMNYVETYQNIYLPLTDYLMLNFEKVLWIQPHQVSILKTAKNQLHSFIIAFQPLVYENFSKFRTVNCKSILYATYHTEKQGLSLIKKLDNLKYNLENQIQFKSQLILQGVYMKFSVIKDQYLILLNQKYHEIYAYFLKVYEKSQNELNNKLKTIIVINVDYLSDYKCREYREEIEEHYKNLLQSLMLLINHFYYLLKESEIYRLLNIAYQFKAQIQHNLNNFYNKLQQYRNNSNKTIKMLEIQNKKFKELYQQLTQRLKKLLVNLVNQRSILQIKNEIMKLDSDFETYSVNNKKLIQSMKENQMVYWQDDQFFSTNMNLLKSSIQFLQGKNFKVFFNTPIGDLTMNEFYNAFEQYSNFINLLIDTKLQKMFKPTFTLIQNNLILAQIVLYKQYTQFQIQKSKQLGFDIALQKTSKVISTIKRYQNLQKKKNEKIVQLYRNSRLNEFNLYHDEAYNCIKLQKERGEFQVQYISNITEIRQFLFQHSSIKSSILLEKVEQLVRFYSQILLFNKMIYLLSQTTLPLTLKESLLQEYNSQYERLLRLNVETAQIQKFKSRLFQQKLRYMQIFYNQKVNIFTRYALCSIEQLVAMEEWKSNQDITRNIRCIFQHVDDVTYDEQGNILTYVIAKDTLTFDKPFNIFEKQGEIAKSIYIHTQNFLRNSVSHSQFACIYIKILIWQIYFTQQVELCFMTEGSLSKVKDYFLQIIKEIANQIRYDIKLHHKSYEIAQLNFFINHIQKIKNMHSITDFQWISTIRYYQKLKIVKVQQNQRVHDYSFQIKKPLPYDPSFQLQTNISYGFKESYQYYQISAYILGKPFATFQTLKNYGFQVNYSVFMNVIKKFQYFIRIIVKPQNFKSINYFHKKILQFSLKKLETLQQQTLSMPILFQYQSEAALPLCFPQKYRNFSNPEFSYDLNLIILLQLNKHQHIIQKSRLNTEILIKVLNIINVKKNLTMKKAVGFIQQLSKFLQQKPEKQEIYKFCYKYFIVNYQVDDHELSLILKELTKQTDKDLEAVTKEKIQFISQFIKQDKKYMIMYGPSSQKTYCLKQMKIPSFYQYDESKKSRVYFIQGIQQFLNCKQELNSNLGIKLIVQDRFIYHIEPSLIADAVLNYSNKLTISNVQTIFKNKILQLKLEGSYQRLWKKLVSFYNVLTEIIAEISLISVTELILRCFESHIKEFLSQLEPQEREYYKLTINKDTLRTFLVITHEILFYMLSHDQRKKFNEKVKILPFMEEHRSEQLQTLTCKGLNCEKILNVIKKQKVTFKNIGNYTKQFILIKKYMKYQQPIAIYSTSKITLKLLKQQIQNLQFNKINITLNDKYTDILRIQKYKKILYVINDLHLQDKTKLTFLKARQQLPSRKQCYYLMLTQNHSYRKVMKHCVGFKFSDIEIEQIYKYQSKQGIIQQTQTNCRNIWKNSFFTNQPTFLMFLINISVKLPSQYYKKYFARQLINSKFTPKVLAIETIAQNQEYIKKVVDISATNAYLMDSKGHHQQITETQVHKKIEKIMGNFGFVEKIIVKQYYKQLISYVLADKIYIIKEQMPILPFIITNIHERKSYTLKKTDFVSQLIQVIEQIYNNDKECTLIIQQPLTSSQEWQQFMAQYLNGVDLINFYSQLRQYTQLLTNKQEYVYRLDDQDIPLKDKVNQIIYSKIKIIVSQTVKSSLALNAQDLYINNIIYLNCSLTNNHKKNIAESIIKKVMADETEEVNELMTKFKPFVLQLIDKQLLFLNRMQLFLNDIITTIKLELEQLIKFKEGMLQKKKLFYNLSLIKEGIDRQFKQTSKNQKQNKMFLNKILQSVNNFEKQPLDFAQSTYYQKLINMRDAFANNQQQKCIWIKEKPQHESICQSLGEIFNNCLGIEYDVPILSLTAQQFTYILQNQLKSKALKQIYQKFSVIPQINTFILLRYIRYLLQLAELYKTLDWNEKLIKNEMKLLNYYYLLDICIQIKVKQKVILRQFEDLTHRKKLIDQFTTILISVQHINLEESDIINYHIFNRVKKVIRSYAIEANEYPLMKILKDYEDRFLSISNNFEQYLLKESESSFQNSNKSMFIQKLKLIVFDPYNKIQQICHELFIRIIYVNSEDDIQQLYDYKFKMTIFCIKLKTLECYYKKRKLIDNCIDIITKKHTDLKENKLEKLVISIDQREILSQIKQQFSVLNLGYNFIKFSQQLEKRTLIEKFQWRVRKQSYISIKKRLSKEIELIKTLNPQEISLYIIKLESIINNFQQRHQQISQISSKRVFKDSQTTLLYNIFKLIINLHKKNEFPINLSLRLMKNIKIEELLSKWKAIQPSSPKEQQDWFKNILLTSRSDNVFEEIEQCISQSRYIAAIYEQFNKKIIKEIIQIQDTKKYVIRTIIEINDEELKEFANSTSFVLDTSETKQIIIFFVKFHEIGKIQAIINKCSVLWI